MSGILISGAGFIILLVLLGIEYERTKRPLGLAWAAIVIFSMGIAIICMVNVEKSNKLERVGNYFGQLTITEDDGLIVSRVSPFMNYLEKIYREQSEALVRENPPASGDEVERIGLEVRLLDMLVRLEDALANPPD